MTVLRAMSRIGVPVFLCAVLSVTVGHLPARAAGGETPHIEHQHWTFGGVLGQYDKAQLRRGFQVYQDVCSVCHGLKRINFRNLVQPGGPEFPEESVKALAKEWDNKILDEPNDDGEVVDEDGELLVRDARLSDPILGPYLNDKAARSANNGALPPDLSLIVKARTIGRHVPWYQHVLLMVQDVVTAYQEAGADYVYGLLIGYKDAPSDVKLQDGMHYNAVFPGHQIAMGQPIANDGSVTYQKDAGATGSLEQNAKDITAFLAWAGDPGLNSRKTLGWQVMLYLLITTLLLYLGKRSIWSRVKH